MTAACLKGPEESKDGLTLNADQDLALSEIMGAARPGRFHLLTGYAGSGKTTLMQELSRRLRAKGKSIVLTAPTHKAVGVLAKKLEQAGIGGIGCATTHTLLSLSPKVKSDRLVFTRRKNATPIEQDVVVIDECSMIGADMMGHIKRHLPEAFVLFVGDPAQLPPVGEVESQTFRTPDRSHLDTIVRQGAGNPVLDAAQIIRQSQGGPMDWSWCRSAIAPPAGVYRPGQQADAWMQKAFTSSQFEDDPDSYRYLAWTNARVAEVNAKIRRWRYGEVDTPFVPSELALFRAPLVRDRTVIFNTNEEAEVVQINRGSHRHRFDKTQEHAGWTAEIPSWRVTLKHSSGCNETVSMPANTQAVNQTIQRVTDEATDSRIRWKHLHEFKEGMAQLQAIYGMTVHTSQGSTFRSVFLDVPDIRRRVKSNLLEAQQLFYVAATRPSQALYPVGA